MAKSASNYGTRVAGADKVIAELRKFGKDVERLIDLETEAISIQMEYDAKQKAPVNFGKLQQSISHEKLKSGKWRVTVNEGYGAYIEFGTGHKVQVPGEWKEMAMTFKGSGFGPKGQGKTFQDGLDSITEWCHAKGIPIIQAKWIFLKILGAGINPQPFLYPAYVKGKRDYLNNLKKLLTRYQKKI